MRQLVARARQLGRPHTKPLHSRRDILQQFRLLTCCTVMHSQALQQRFAPPSLLRNWLEADPESGTKQFFRIL
jgi:hypothetical protein